jgi:hypothetical protein
MPSNPPDLERVIARAGCGALLAENATGAERRVCEAIAVHADSTRPFERARTELAFGAFLRRSRRRVAARQQLRADLDQFEQRRRGQDGRGWSRARAARPPGARSQ